MHVNKCYIISFPESKTSKLEYLKKKKNASNVSNLASWCYCSCQKTAFILVFIFTGYQDMHWLSEDVMSMGEKQKL